MTESESTTHSPEAVWRSFLMHGEDSSELRQRRLLRFLPGSPRCKFCYAPLHGGGALIARWLYGKQPSHMNPRICNVCEQFARKHQGGAEIEMTLLFADVRGSTTLAEKMHPMAYSRLINRFYNAAAHVLTHTDALIDKIIGDQVAGFYVPGMVGGNHAARAMEAARAVLEATGHDQDEGPWIPLGAAVHTGVAFVGSVGSAGGTIDITVLGDAANTAARLASAAAVGEILISSAAMAASGRGTEGVEMRELSLKGKQESVSVASWNPFLD